MRRPPLGVGLLALTAALAACGGPVQPSAGPLGIAPAANVTPAADGTWSLTAPTGTLRVTGRPSSLIYVAVHVSTRCASSRIRLGGSIRTLTKPTDLTTSVLLGASGAATLPVAVNSDGCASSTPYAALQNPMTALIGPGAAPWTVPAAGYSRPDSGVIGLGWWQQKPAATIAVHGRPGQKVVLRIAVTPPPCLPEVELRVGGDTKEVVSVPRWVSHFVRIGPRAVTVVPVETTRGSCPTGTGVGPVYVHLNFQTLVAR